MVAVNDVHPATFLKKYNSVESKLSELFVNVVFWLQLDESIKQEYLSEIRSDLNIGKGDGLQHVAKDLSLSLLGE